MVKTLHYKDFVPFSQLADRKKRLGKTVSVVVPALNEESTIGNIVASLRASCMGSCRLIDEVVVMDGCSEDATVAIAQKAGALVARVDQVGPPVGVRGKGVALWKSQFVAQGDIVVYIDSDLIDFDERFVAGLVGPLLNDDSCTMAKACYRRPLVIGGTILEDSGGRVTELLVRPLLNSFIPELGFMLQPLAGEYALRRETISRMPYFSGYGVEIGLLLEHFFTEGITAIVQVDMGSRMHRNRTLPELSRMAFGIQQALFMVLEQHGYCSFHKPRSTIMRSLHARAWEAFKTEEVALPAKNAIEKE